MTCAEKFEPGFIIDPAMHWMHTARLHDR